MEFRPILSTLLRNKTGPLLVAVQVALSLGILANALHIVNVRQAVAARSSGIANEHEARREAILACAFVQVAILPGREVGIDTPPVDTDERGKVGRHPIVSRKVLALSAHMPTGMNGRDQCLARRGF